MSATTIDWDRNLISLLTEGVPLLHDATPSSRTRLRRQSSLVDQRANVLDVVVQSHRVFEESLPLDPL